MLSGSKSSFKIKQLAPELQVNMRAKFAGTYDEKNGTLGFKCLPGEYIKQAATHVKKYVPSRCGKTFIWGSLFCTNFRISFVPQVKGHNTEKTSNQIILNREHDVVLACIDRVVGVTGQSRSKVLTANSIVRGLLEELVIYCKDFRELHFQFGYRTPQSECIQISTTIAQSYQELSTDHLLTIQRDSTTLWRFDHDSLIRKDVFGTQMFEALQDWEDELMRMGALGWRVSPVNERFDMSTSLPKYNVVPSALLDTDLQKMFTLFNERRIPRLCWHHPRGSDFLRMAYFQTNTDPEKEDMRIVEMLMLACHSQCVLVDVTDDLPNPSEIQTAHVKLRNLCMAFESSVAESDEKWLSTLENTHWLEYVRLCLKKSWEVASLLAERCLCAVLQEPEDRDLNCLVASVVQVMSEPHFRTIRGFQSLIQKEWVVAGHQFRQRLNFARDKDKEESPVFLLFLDCVWQLLQQYPTSFEFTEAYLLAVHDSTHIPFFSTFLSNSQRERQKTNQHLPSEQSYTPVNGWSNLSSRDNLLSGNYLLSKEKTSLPVVWEWSLQYDSHYQALFTNPYYSDSTANTVLNGSIDIQGTVKSDPGCIGSCSVYLLSKGSLSLQTQYLPWKTGSGPKKGSRRAHSVESLSELERSLRKKSVVPVSTDGILLPLLVGPFIRLWKRCYLRGSQGAEVVASVPDSEFLTEEMMFLQTCLKELQLSLDSYSDKKHASTETYSAFRSHFRSGPP
ncbi:myotubularin-related protein 11 [Protopterus annectens]|uniref:myotubularin-related protein 11 n=1 Tax=Protopterus annectens TaxID=7888 RepID=UPI001CFAC462|nr:myotubularin-related protein 11 [Protopterus annectens]